MTAGRFRSPPRDHAVAARRSRLPTIVLLAAVLAAATLACDDGPSDPAGGPMFVSGELANLGLSSHPVTLTDDSILTIELAELSVVETSSILIDPSLLGVGVGIGQPTADSCSLTARFTLTVGRRLLFSLRRGEYCVAVFDSGGLPPETTLAYTLQLEIDT